MISLVAAMANNNVIGNKGVIPWKIKSEQQRFRNLTQGKTIIIGRISYEEISNPLPDRKIIVISGTKKFNGCITVSSLAEALDIAKNEAEIFIAGGGQVYRDTIELADMLYLTKIDLTVDGDVFFPKFDESQYVKIYEEQVDNDIPYTFYTYKRII